MCALCEWSLKDQNKEEYFLDSYLKFEPKRNLLSQGWFASIGHQNIKEETFLLQRKSTKVSIIKKKLSNVRRKLSIVSETARPN